MSWLTDTILNLIKIGRTINEISEITKLSHKQNMEIDK